MIQVCGASVDHKSVENLQKDLTSIQETLKNIELRPLQIYKKMLLILLKI